MSLLRSIRQPYLLRPLARNVTPTTAIAGRRFAGSDYGSGASKSGTPKSQIAHDVEHPGPPPPKAAQQGKEQQQQQATSQSSGKSGDSSKAQPKILNENPPAKGEESEEVARHNREVSQRYDRAEEKVKNEDAEKDKVPKGFWSGQGGKDREP